MSNRRSPSGPKTSSSVRRLVTTVSDPIPSNYFSAVNVDNFLGFANQGDTVNVTYNGILVDQRPELIFHGRVTDDLGTVQVIVSNNTINNVSMPVGGFDVTIEVSKL